MHGAGVSEREKFEQWKAANCHPTIPARDAELIYEGYRGRQPEIDAIKQKNSELESSYSGCQGANASNKALIRRLGEVNDALKEELGLCYGTLESRERNIETIKTEVLKLSEYRDKYLAVLEENAALREEVEKLRKYAERYQFLRDRDIETIDKGGVFAGLTPDNLVLNGAELDSAIDATMKETK